MFTHCFSLALTLSKLLTSYITSSKMGYNLQSSKDFKMKQINLFSAFMEDFTFYSRC